MENPPFEDVFPIQDGDFPLLCLFTGGYPTLSSSINQPWIFEGQSIEFFIGAGKSLEQPGR